MTIFFWIMTAVFVLLVVGYIRGETRYRRILEEMAWGNIEPALDDHHLTVWERLPLYDWEAEGHL